MFPICTYVIQDIFCVCLGSLEDPNVRHAERVTIKKGLMTQYAKPVVKVNMKIYHKKYACRHIVNKYIRRGLCENFASIIARTRRVLQHE